MKKEDIRLLCLERKYKFLIYSILFKDPSVVPEIEVFVFKRSSTLNAIWIEILALEFYPSELQLLLKNESFGFFNIGVFEGKVILEGRLRLEEEKY